MKEHLLINLRNYYCHHERSKVISSLDERKEIASSTIAGLAMTVKYYISTNKNGGTNET
jgi:hypothetical protein